MYNHPKLNNGYESIGWCKIMCIVFHRDQLDSATPLEQGTAKQSKHCGCETVKETLDTWD